MTERIYLDRGDSGIVYAWFDDTTGELLSIERVEDVEPVLEPAKSCFNDGLVNRKSEFRRVGTYPMSVV
jgi:hypothetical protein